MHLLTAIVEGLRDIGPAGWPEVERATGVKASTIRKLAYQDRQNPTLAVLQPLLDHLDLEVVKRKPARRKREG